MSQAENITMTGLGHAHSGYEYQDLVTALCGVDLILRRVLSIHVDRKLFDGDRFDDLAFVDSAGRRIRCQIKHQMSPEPLSVDTFVRDDRSLQLDRLVRAAAADRDAFPDLVDVTQYRLLLRDTDPVDAVLGEVLVPAPAGDDPGPLLRSTETRRYRFDAGKLWKGVTRKASGRRPAGDAYEFLRSGADSINRDDLERLCQRLVIEVNAPAMTGDLLNPGPLEQLLLAQLIGDLGAGVFPNEDRPPVDVAEAIVRAARTERSRQGELSVDDLMRRGICQVKLRRFVPELLAG
jgi:hypothetical protein